MAETDVLTYLQTPPRRPVISDLHGGIIENDAEFPPDPGDPEANAMNQSDKLMVHAHELIDGAKLYVTVSGTTAIAGVWPSTLEAGDFTVVDNGVGDTSITHTGGLLPAATWPATVDVVGNSGGRVGDVESIANGWRIRMRNASTLALADVPFILKISGL